MNDEDRPDQVVVDKTTLETLRSFADAHATEYAWTTAVYDAIIEAGRSLSLDDPTPSTKLSHVDTDALREFEGDEVVDALYQKWGRCAEMDTEQEADR